MKSILLFFFLSSFFIFDLISQQGAPLYTHFGKSKGTENLNWVIICQDKNNLMLFANRKGILSFDGQDWKNIIIPVVPYAMQKNPHDGKIYIGGNNNYGFLQWDNSGTYKYISLSGARANLGIITRILFNDSLIWFYSDQSVTRYNTTTKSSELLIQTKPGESFSGMVIIRGHTFVNIFEKGLHQIVSDTLRPVVSASSVEKISFLFTLRYNSSMVLVGLSNGRLLLFDGIKYYDYSIKDEGYLRDNILSDGIVLGDTAFAFSTLDGGALVIDKKSRKILYSINHQYGLPDDEVFAIGTDNSGGLWLSHQYGLTRADMVLPVRNYSIFPGLRGNLTSVLKYGEELYVATSEGVFYLSEIKNYSDIEILKQDGSQTISSLPGPSASVKKSKKKDIKSFVRRIFGKKTNTQEVAQKNKVISIKYIYKKVDGLNEKCRQLVSTPYGIMVASNKGLFIINNHKAMPLVSNRYINFITRKPRDGVYYVGANDGYFAIMNKGGRWKVEIWDHEFFSPVYSICNQGSTLWLGGENSAYRAELDNSAGKKNYTIYSIDNDYFQRYKIDLINDSIFLFTESGIYYFNTKEEKFDAYNKSPDYFNRTNFRFSLSKYPLIKLNDEWVSVKHNLGIENIELSLLKIFDDIIAISPETNFLWIIGGDNQLYAIDRKRTSEMGPSTTLLIKNISNGKGTSLNLNNVKFKRGDNLIFFDVIAPFYIKQNTIQYQYNISKVMDEWSPWSVSTHYEKTITKPGTFVLKVRAKDIWNNICESQSVAFTIKEPFTKTLFFYVIIGIILLSSTVLVMRLRERQLYEKNRILEEKVSERTAEIKAQKEEITSSIKYASRIQSAMLPLEDHFKELLSDYFIFYKPKDIVSGDFFWIGTDDTSIFFSVADCTGHGVPGAFMSALGISTLNEILANNHIQHANTVLNLLRTKIKMYLHQTGKEGEAKDGMDIAFCMLGKNRELLQFAGAFNSLLIFHNNEIKEYKADRMPIGIHYGDERPFTNHTINMNKGETIYIFSDGFADQFGGPDGEKYKMSNFKKLLLNIYNKPMEEQRNIIESEFAKWKGPTEQTDDVTILGLRI